MVSPASLIFFLLIRLSDTGAVTSSTSVYFISDGAWNLYCNQSSYASLRSPDASVTLSVSHPSQDHKLYGSCLLQFHNPNPDGKLHLTFLSYPAFHECSNGRLAMYEIVNGINTILWEGQCSDAPHRWPPRVVESQTNNIWIWYAKAEEWPSILPYTGIKVKLLITKKPIPKACDDSICSQRGHCAIRNAQPPQNLTNFVEERNIWKCHCIQPYTGISCSDIDFLENACTPGPCLNHGRCVIDTKFSSGYYCDCPMPFSGDHCEFNSAVCEGNNICGVNGVCRVQAGTVVCLCKEGWVGVRCSIVNPCLSLPCLNSGTCMSLAPPGFICLCTDRWTGDVCSTKWVTPHEEQTIPDNKTDNAFGKLTESKKSSGLVVALVVLGVVAFLLAGVCLIYRVKKRTRRGRNSFLNNPLTDSLSRTERFEYPTSVTKSPADGRGEDYTTKSFPDSKQSAADKPVISAKVTKITEASKSRADKEIDAYQEYSQNILESFLSAIEKNAQLSETVESQVELKTRITPRAAIQQHRQEMAERMRKAKLRFSLPPPVINIVSPYASDRSSLKAGSAHKPDIKDSVYESDIIKESDDEGKRKMSLDKTQDKASKIDLEKSVINLEAAPSSSMNQGLDGKERFDSKSNHRVDSTDSRPKSVKSRRSSLNHNSGSEPPSAKQSDTRELEESQNRKESVNEQSSKLSANKIPSDSPNKQTGRKQSTISSRSQKSPDLSPSALDEKDRNFVSPTVGTPVTPDTVPVEATSNLSQGAKGSSP